MSPKKSLTLEERLENLQQFRILWVEFGNFVADIIKSGKVTPSDEGKYLQYINHISLEFPRVQMEIQRHGLTIARPVPLGGGSYSIVPNFNPFMNIATICPSLSELFQGGRFAAKECRDTLSSGDRMLLHALGTLQFAIELGGEENLPSQEVTSTRVVDILSGIRRALRPAFKEPPADEIKVQDQVEVILNTLGVKFEREAQIEHATKHVKPDFVLHDLNTAIEVKFCDSKPDEKRIIEEIGSDIVGYRNTYPAIIFIVYDVATISDKDKFVSGFKGESGVLIEIIS